MAVYGIISSNIIYTSNWGKRTKPKFLVLLRELKPAMWSGVKVISGMGLPILHKMSILRHKVSFLPLPSPLHRTLPFPFLNNWGNIYWHSSSLGWKAGLRSQLSDKVISSIGSHTPTFLYEYSLRKKGKMCTAEMYEGWGSDENDIENVSYEQAEISFWTIINGKHFL